MIVTSVDARVATITIAAPSASIAAESRAMQQLISRPRVLEVLGQLKAPILSQGAPS